MPKLQRKPAREYDLNGTMITVQPVPGKQMIGYFKVFNEHKENYDRLYDMYIDIISEYTDLENTKEELAEILEYQEATNLANFILNIDTEENLD